MGNQETSWEAIRENKEEMTVFDEKAKSEWITDGKKAGAFQTHFGARSTGGPWGGGQGRTERGPGFPGGLSLMRVD